MSLTQIVKWTNDMKQSWNVPKLSVEVLGPQALKITSYDFDAGLLQR